MKATQLLMVFLCISTFLCVAPCASQVRVPKRPKVPTELTPAGKDRVAAIAKKRIDDAMNAELLKVQQNSAGSGMLVGIVKNNRIVHLEAYGWSNEADRTPMSLGDKLSWASISKVLTAVVAWQQMADPNIQLGLNTRASTVLPEWIARDVSDRNNKARVTVEQLLRHRAGIGHYTSSPTNRDIINQDWENRYRRVRTIKPVEWNATASVAYYNDKVIGNGNNGEYEYTTFGTCVLAAILDRKARESTDGQLNYVSWVQQKVARRAGMNGLRIDPDFRHNLPGAGWSSTVEDLTKFMHALMNDRLVPMSQLTQAIVPGNAAGAHYGCGVTRRGVGRQLYLGHRGLQPGTRTSMLMLATQSRERQTDGSMKTVYAVDPEKFGVVIMINDKASSVNMDAITMAAYNATH